MAMVKADRLRVGDVVLIDGAQVRIVVAGVLRQGDRAGYPLMALMFTGPDGHLDARYLALSAPVQVVEPTDGR